MTHDDVIRIAHKAGIDWDDQSECTTYRVDLCELQRFAAMVAAESESKVLASLANDSRKDAA